MKKQNLHILKFENLLIRFSFNVVMLVALILIISSNVIAQKLTIYAIAPEWNNKTFCDNGVGYQPSIITAPSLSYSGAVTDKINYTYQWEQAIDNGNWKTVLEVKDAQYIPGYTPSLLMNNDNVISTKYAWRLKITDVANGGQQVFSDVYTITLYNPIKVTPQILIASTNPKLFDINLSVIGGSPTKTYKWVNADSNLEVLNTQNAKNLIAGNYLVTINAEGCLPLNINISTNKLDNTNN